MNETITNILERRSIRKFEEKQIEDEKIKILMECAISSPTAKNSQNWHFSVIQNKDLLALLPPNVFNAPTVIMIFAEPTGHWYMMDAGIACENICIAAKSLGLETCIIGSIRDKLDNKLLESLNIPNNYEFMIAISIGYSNSNTVPKIIKENLFEIVK